jgi:hypothetical protein
VAPPRIDPATFRFVAQLPQPLRHRNPLQTKAVGKTKTHYLFSHFFSENLAVYWKKWKKIL